MDVMTWIHPLDGSMDTTMYTATACMSLRQYTGKQQGTAYYYVVVLSAMMLVPVASPVLRKAAHVYTWLAIHHRRSRPYHIVLRTRYLVGSSTA